MSLEESSRRNGGRKQNTNVSMDLPTHHRHTAKNVSSKQQQQQQQNGITRIQLSPQSSFYDSNTATTSNNNNTIPYHQQHATTSLSHSYSSQFMMGLNIAGVASFILQTTYSLFYVDVFLFAYKLPIQSYSQGNMVFAFINTANDLLGAYFLDNYIATYRISRGDMIGIIGVLFSILFLMPFFRFWIPTSNIIWSDDTNSTTTGFLHFVISVSAYDTMYSITAILLGSLVTDNHTMTDNERIWFMASGKIVNLIAALVVARIGLSLFDIDYLVPFQLYLIIISCFVAAMFIIAQIMTRYIIIWPPPTPSTSKFNHLHKLRFIDTRKQQQRRNEYDDVNTTTTTTNDDSLNEETKKKVSKRMKLQPKQVFKDFYNHKNFWAWIGMEIFLECQVSFSYAFLKTFMDRLVYIDDDDENRDNGMILGVSTTSRGAGYSREVCDWFLSIIRPLGLIMGVMCYIPIRKFGYQKLYPILFIVNGVLSLIVWIFGDHTSTTLILLFLIVYPTITSAVMSSGFHLVMSDMVLEMKKRHTKEGRYDEPSLAGLFMGINALFCKPAESILPIVTAHMLGDVKFDDINFHHHDHNDNRSDAIEEAELEDVRKVLFQVLVLPPLIFSILQYLSWQRYTLTPTKTNQMREELTKLHKTRSDRHLQTTAATSSSSSSPPMSSDHIA